MDYIRKFESAQKHREASERYLAIVNGKIERHLGEGVSITHQAGDGWCIVHESRNIPITSSDLHKLLAMGRRAAFDWLKERSI